MKAVYITPETEIIRFEAEDVICTSDPVTNTDTDTKIL